MAEIQFGLDISHHQDARLDLARCAREGITFVILKATEGAAFNDSEFAANLAEARAAGLLVAAYHYQRPDPVARQVANIRDSVPLDVPVVLDVEAGSGSVALTRELVAALRTAGYRVPLTYLPRWYWQQIGSPSLTGLPPLWSSRYPDKVVGTIADEWDDVPSSYWHGYGGLNVAVLQFTSVARIAGHHPIDANAYRGTHAQLAALLGGATPSEEDDMPTLQEIEDAAYRAVRNLLVDAHDAHANGVPNEAAHAIRGVLHNLPVAATTDVAELVETLAPSLVAALAGQGATGLTQDQVAAAVRQVLGETRLTVRQDAAEAR